MSKNNKRLSVDDLLLEIEKLKKENTQLKKRKKYGLVWEDKPEVFDEKTKNSLPVLKEKGGKFKDIIKDKDDNYNILIEGDNYHSLSVLNYTHRNKVDVIYIDPPYNTGNKDFIYNDHFVDREDSFRHSKWLSFMSKRLKLAKNLLKDDGIIFISIDANEQAQLKLLCDEIFRTENHINTFSWINNLKGRQISNVGASQTYEYIFCYAKNYMKAPLFIGDSSKLKKAMPAIYKSKDYEIQEDSRGKYIIKNELHNTNAYFNEETRPNLTYNIYYNEKLNKVLFSDLNKDIKKVGYIKISPKKNNNNTHTYHAWRWSKQKVKNELYNLLFVKSKKSYKIYTKIRNINSMTIKDIILAYPTNTGGTLLREVLQKKIFDYPKPLELIKFLINQIEYKDGLILDFMAGSGTTGHAVLDLNKEDGGNRKFILCTNNENKICEDVTWERIKRVSKGYKKQNGEKVEGLGGNLKYLKTDFISIENNADNLKEKVVEASTEILCLKENTFTEVIDDYKGNKIKIFENKDKYTAILFDLFYFDEFVKELEKLKDKKVSIYVFSYTKDFSANEFSELDINFTVEAIPEKVLETYKKIFNF